MKNAGIICEYNPFHNGHAYHIAQTRKALGGGGIICVMSGNAVQRGEPAMFSKHSRAEAAVRNGADLVIELPLPWAVSSAEGFAFGAVSLLDSLGVCTHLSFGSEAGNIGGLHDAAEMLRTEEYDETIRHELNAGISFAAARQKAAEKILGPRAEVFRRPNNILGIEYIKALTRLESDIEPLTVERKGAEHDGEEASQGVSSASSIRECIRGGGSPWEYVPHLAAEIFKREIAAGRGPVNMKNFELPILSALRKMDERDFMSLPDGSEGLYRRLMGFCGTEGSVREIIEKTKTKRYAMSRIRRMVMCAWLGVRKEDSAGEPPYVRVLAFNEAGQAILKDAAKSCRVPIITKPASAKSLPNAARRIFELEAASMDLYVLAYNDAALRQGGQEWRSGPVMV